MRDIPIEFVPTIGGRLFYLGDKSDEGAPMLELKFNNELNDWLTEEQKTRIAREVLEIALDKINQITGE
jgi:hypothetical protein